MKTDLVHQIKNDFFTNTLIVAENLEVLHTNLLRTVRRLITNGMEDQFLEKSFTNKQGRTYPMYEMTLKASIALETIYLMSDKSIERGDDATKSTKNNDSVYFISNNKGAVKIGYTSALRTRLTAVQLGCDSYCELIATIKGSRDLEKQAHDFFKNEWISGEWFSINEEDICNFVSSKNLRMHVTYHDTIKSILFDLWHDSNVDEEEPDFDIIYTINTKEAMSKILSLIKKCMVEKMHYKDIYHYAKSEVNKLADVLVFKPRLK